MARLPDGRALPGKLFIVEGIDGSGKSTQLDLLRKWLIGQGYCVAFSEWNSSPLVKATTKKGKKKQMLTPASFSRATAACISSSIFAARSTFPPNRSTGTSDQRRSSAGTP